MPRASSEITIKSLAWGKIYPPLSYHSASLCDMLDFLKDTIYLKIFDINRTKSHNLNDSRLVLQFSLPNPLKPGVR